jgi:hypothetical protein
MEAQARARDDENSALKLSKLVNPAQREYVGAMSVWEDVKMVRGL